MQYEPDSIITELIDATETGAPRAWRQAGLYHSPGRALELKDGSISWNFEVHDAGGFLVFKPTFLAEFVALARSGVADEQILVYAQKWGLLELCPEGLPRTHDQSSVPASLAHAMQLTPRARCDRGGVGDPERLEWWRYWASQAASLGAIVAALRLGDRADPHDWEAILAPGPWAVGSDWERVLSGVADQLGYLHGIKTISQQRQLAVRALQRWITLANLRPEIKWASGMKVRVEFRPASLFGALGLQIVFLSADIDGLALCDGCHAMIVPARRPGFPAQRVYCEHCRAEGVPQREASLAHYRRRSAEPAFRQMEADRQRRRRADKRATDPR